MLGDKLIKLLRDVLEVPEDFADADAQECCRYLLECNMPPAVQLLKQFQTQLSPQEVQRGMVCLVPGERFGKTFLVNRTAPQVQEGLDSGMFIPSLVAESLIERVSTLVGCAALWVDHFRIEVMGKPGYRAVGPHKGCARCGALEAQSGEEEGGSSSSAGSSRGGGGGG